MRYRLNQPLDSLKATQRLAIAMVQEKWLQPGRCLGLDGPLGAGKTTLTQAIGKALDITEPVTSPTFGLLHRYLSGRFPLVQLDWYRLGEVPREDLLWELDEILQAGDTLVVMEWPCLVPGFVVDALTHYFTLSIKPSSETRQLTGYSLNAWSGRTKIVDDVSLTEKLSLSRLCNSSSASRASGP